MILSKLLTKSEKVLNDTVNDEFFQTISKSIKNRFALASDDGLENSSSSSKFVAPKVPADKASIVNAKRLIHQIEETLRNLSTRGGDDNDDVMIEEYEVLLVYITDGIQLLKNVDGSNRERRSLLDELQRLQELVKPDLLRFKDLKRTQSQPPQIEQPKQSSDSVNNEVQEPVKELVKEEEIKPQIKAVEAVQPKTEHEESVGLRRRRANGREESNEQTKMKRPVSFHSRRIQGHLRKELMKEIEKAESERATHAEEGSDDESNKTQYDQKYEDIAQEQLTSEVKDLAGMLKERALAIQSTLATDNMVLDDSANLFENNLSNVKTEQQNLTAHTSNVRFGMLRTTSMIIFVVAMFFFMFLVIQIFPKR